MLKMFRRFWNEEEGFGTVELVILIGILVAVALIFRGRIIGFVNGIMDSQMNPSNIPDPTTT